MAAGRRRAYHLWSCWTAGRFATAVASVSSWQVCREAWSAMCRDPGATCPHLLSHALFAYNRSVLTVSAVGPSSVVVGATGSGVADAGGVPELGAGDGSSDGTRTRGLTIRPLARNCTLTATARLTWRLWRRFCVPRASNRLARSAPIGAGHVGLAHRNTMRRTPPAWTRSTPLTETVAVFELALGLSASRPDTSRAATLSVPSSLARRSRRTGLKRRAKPLRRQPVLSPPYDSRITDYGVRCQPLAPVTVGLELPAGTNARVNGVLQEGSRIRAAVRLDLGERMTLAITDAEGSRTANIRCVPPDMASWSVERTGLASHRTRSSSSRPRSSAVGRTRLPRAAGLRHHPHEFDRARRRRDRLLRAPLDAL